MYLRNPPQDFYPVSWQARMYSLCMDVEAVKIIGIAATGIKVECPHSMSVGQVVTTEFYINWQDKREQLLTKTCVTCSHLYRNIAVAELLFTSISKERRLFLNKVLDHIKHSQVDNFSTKYFLDQN